jgi:hypothetical protein
MERFTCLNGALAALGEATRRNWERLAELEREEQERIEQEAKKARRPAINLCPFVVAGDA